MSTTSPVYRRTLASTYRRSIVDNRVGAARRIVDVLYDRLPGLDRDELVWALAELDDDDWAALATAAGLDRTPSELTRWTVIGMIAGGHDE